MLYLSEMRRSSRSEEHVGDESVRKRGKGKRGKKRSIESVVLLRPGVKVCEMLRVRVPRFVSLLFARGLFV